MPALPPFLALPGRLISSLAARADLQATTTGILTPSRVLARQAGTTTVVVVPSDTEEGNRTSTLSGGAIAGIVIGSIIGLLLLLWIIRSCSNLGAPKEQRDQAWYDDVEADRRRPRSRPRSSHRHHDHDRQHHHHHHHSRSRSQRRSAEMRTVTPVVVHERGARSPRRPSATYVYEDPRRVSRSRSRGY